MIIQGTDIHHKILLVHYNFLDAHHFDKFVYLVDKIFGNNSLDFSWYWI